MSSVTRVQLSLPEKLGLCFTLLVLVPPLTAFHVVTTTILSVRRGLRLKFSLLCALMRVAFYVLGPRHFQAIYPSSIETYQAWMRQSIAKAKQKRNTYLEKRLKCDMESLPDGKSTIMWIGDRKIAQKVVLYMHGGGYMIPLLAQHLDACVEIFINAGREKGVEIAVAVLQYTLLPARVYPMNLRQATSALDRLLGYGFAPQDIIIGGDSAGANLAVQVLCHILHPHPGTSEIKLTRPLAAVLLVAPFGSRNTESGSFRENRRYDMLTGDILDELISAIFNDRQWKSGPVGEKRWALALEEDENWLEGMSSVVKEVCIDVGECEVMRDHGIELAERLRLTNPGLNVVLSVAMGETHDYMLSEVGFNQPGNAITRLNQWAKGLL